MPLYANTHIPQLSKNATNARNPKHTPPFLIYA